MTVIDEAKGKEEAYQAISMIHCSKQKSLLSSACITSYTVVEMLLGAVTFNQQNSALLLLQQNISNKRHHHHKVLRQCKN